MKQILLINASGADRPGVTSAITQVLQRYQATILDIGQAVIHDTLALGLLVAMDTGEIAEPELLAELQAATAALNINIRFTPISHDSYSQWVEHQGKAR